MYTPSAFSETRPELLREVIDAFPLATVIVADLDGGVDAEVVPLIWLPEPARPESHGRLLGHLARGNPLAALGSVEALVQFRGPEGYISPSWYPEKREHHRVVPTWNYVVVEARGRMSRIDDSTRVFEILGVLTDRFEGRLAQPWRVTDAPPEYVTSLVDAIVGIEIEVRAIGGKFKLSQNKGDATRAGVVAGLRATGGPRESELADWMQRPSR
jgi:transcriptional regulator